MRVRTRSGLLVLGALILGGLVYGFWPKAVAVDAGTVERGYFRVSVEAQGKTRVKEEFVISAPVAGFSRRVEIHVGDRVEKNQVLLELEPLPAQVLDPRSHAEAKARVAASKAALSAASEQASAAQADADFARSEYERIEKLSKVQSVSKSDLDRAATRRRSAAATERSARRAVEVAAYELKAARTALTYSAATKSDQAHETVLVRAPVAGYVLKVHHESEGVVSAGRPLLNIGDPRELEVEVDVLSMDAVRIKPGMRVLLERWGGEGDLEGRVRVVEPVGFTKISALGVEEQRVWVIVDITSDPARWAHLGHGYRVEARFVIWEGEQVMQVPASALFRHEAGWAVFVVEGARARLRPIEPGRRGGMYVEVSAGLEAGERVITHPHDALAHGTRVRLR